MVLSNVLHLLYDSSRNFGGNIDTNALRSSTNPIGNGKSTVNSITDPSHTGKYTLNSTEFTHINTNSHTDGPIFNGFNSTYDTHFAQNYENAMNFQYNDEFKGNYKGNSQQDVEEFDNDEECFDIKMNCFSCEQIEQEERNILDSGTSLLITRIKSDVAEICTDKRVTLKTISGAADDAVLCVLKPNPFGLRTGVYKSGLPCKRLVPSTHLNNSGFDVHLLADCPSSIDSVCSGESFSVVNEYPGLPYLEQDVVFGRPRKIDTYMTERLSLGSRASGGDMKKRKIEFSGLSNSALDRHRRRAHISVPGQKIHCPECDIAKGRKKSAKSVRPEKYVISTPLYELDCDFMGKISPTSIRGNSWVFVAICPAISYPFVMPGKLKTDAYSLLPNLVNRLRATDSKTLNDKVVHNIRSDNEQLLKGKYWDEILLDLKLKALNSVPYTPQMNGVVERWMGTQTQQMKACLVGVDVRLWCYCLEYIADVWVRLPRKSYKRAPQFDGMTPLQARRCRTGPVLDSPQTTKVTDDNMEDEFENKFPEDKFRRFGCLCYYLQEPREHIPKVKPKFVKGVFLGFSRSNNSAWLVGTYHEDDRCTATGGFRWSDTETRDVKFVESVLIDNVDSLRPDFKDGVVVSDEVLLKTICGSEGVQPVVATGQSCAPELVLPRGPVESGGGELSPSNTSKTSPSAKQAPSNEKVTRELNKVIKNSLSSDVQDPKFLPAQTESAKTSSTTSTETEALNNAAGPPTTKIGDLESEILKAQKQTLEGLPKDRHGRAEPKPKGKAGRPKGKKDLRKRHRRKKAEMAAESHLIVDEDQRQCTEELFANCFSVQSLHQDLEKGETVEECYIYLTIKEALNGPDAPRWITAINKEFTKLLGFDTWRSLNDEELKRVKNPVPMALVLTRKRDGTYKCRAVCLGNLYKPTGTLEVYAGVLSAPASRYLLVNAAAEGDYEVIFDIDNAFVQSLIDTEIFVRLPPQFREDQGDNGLRKLIKALYGLPQAPRLWAKHYESGLLKLGWNQSMARGLWRKPSSACPGKKLKLGVYVDDNTATGPCRAELDSEVEKILNVFPGKIIKPEMMPDGFRRYDILGSDVFYRRETKELKITMESYIKKMAQKFRMDGCRPVDNPCFQESQLYDEKSPRQDYPVSEVIGCLSWAACACRADISHPVSVLSRITCKPTTKGIVYCIKKVLRYLINTPEIGLYYSPQMERSFNETYDKIRSDGQQTQRWNAFSDASFASDFVTLKSISGSLIYYRGTPIAWRPNRQSVRTNSTFESEFVAMSDTLILESSLDFLGFFGEPTDGTLWCDNQTAVTVAKSPSGGERPKSRHVALRYLRVVDVADRIQFCPTEHMKADTLTKLNVSGDIRKNLFYHNPDMKNARKQAPDCEEQEQLLVLNDDIGCCFYSTLEYLDDI